MLDVRFIPDFYIFVCCIHLHRLVRILYKIRNPHCRQRTGSLALITLIAPQSPHRYSTPLINGAADAGAAGADGVLIIL
jgi:hypothetical protein